MKGIILANLDGSTLQPTTAVVPKVLLPIADKPMIYYPLTALMQLGINEILIVSEGWAALNALLGDGRQWGDDVDLRYAVDTGFVPAFLDGEPAMLICGDDVEKCLLRYFVDGRTTGLRTDTSAALYQTSRFIAEFQEVMGTLIGSPEATALENGWLEPKKFVMQMADGKLKTEYEERLFDFAKGLLP